MLGTNISQIEVLGLSKHGFWLLLDEDLYFPVPHNPTAPDYLSLLTP